MGEAHVGEVQPQVADELSKHIATWPYNHKKGRPHQGIRCTCGDFDVETEPPALRPWDAFYDHVAEAVLRSLAYEALLANRNILRDEVIRLQDELNGPNVHKGVCTKCGAAVLRGEHLREDLPPCFGVGPRRASLRHLTQASQEFEGDYT